ncbi:OsmC family protein [Mesorhizobium sp. BR1-1-16]|uniref:OsmC family protein n=1 Tax=Mesorhizobium sp. BR1-1-16 TaxID=2876653 RepID=UPI001CCBAB8D|nr:OsmC family protein [Mesorhizobium sp. BR1-1-16]MBZ9937293.1 OsmC family protein [Mesorhizobium sp. BR1-1-16]
MAKVKAVLGTANYAVSIEAGPHALSADEPSERGGHGTGPGPYDLVLAGLAACTVITLRMYAERKGWELGSIHAELTHSKIDKRSHIVRTLSFEGMPTEEQVARLLEIAGKTPVTLTLKEGAEIVTHIAPAHHAETPAELDERLDEALEESFPASDPPSVSPGEG